MKAMTNEARAAIATGWLNSPLKLADYAAEVGVAPRTIRLYAQRLAGRQGEQQPPGAPDVEVDVQTVLADVAKLLERIDNLRDEAARLRALVTHGAELAGRHDEAGTLVQMGEADRTNVPRPSDTIGSHGAEPLNPGAGPQVLPGHDASRAERQAVVAAPSVLSDKSPASAMSEVSPKRKRRGAFVRGFSSDDLLDS